jgi:hypothetical protein
MRAAIGKAVYWCSSFSSLRFSIEEESLDKLSSVIRICLLFAFFWKSKLFIEGFLSTEDSPDNFDYGLFSIDDYLRGLLRVSPKLVT